MSSYKFNKNNISIILEKDKYESIDNFMKRGYFIINHSEKEIINNYDNLVKLSKLFINQKILKMKYNKKLFF